MITIIVAVDLKNGIGLDGKLPWRIKEEFQHFSTTTKFHTLVMGRKTFEGVGALKDRKIIVITSDQNYTIDENIGTVCHDFESLLKHYQDKDEEIFICGGRSIYQQALPYTDRLLLSRIKEEYVVDTYFPEFDESLFELVDEKEYDRFVVYDYRRKN